MKRRFVSIRISSRYWKTSNIKESNMTDQVQDQDVELDEIEIEEAVIERLTNYYNNQK